jgi:hypothetical protein
LARCVAIIVASIFVFLCTTYYQTLLLSQWDIGRFCAQIRIAIRIAKKTLDINTIIIRIFYFFYFIKMFLKCFSKVLKILENSIWSDVFWVSWSWNKH